jgi:thioredoxin-like negative regulator of GroEL
VTPARPAPARTRWGTIRVQTWTAPLTQSSSWTVPQLAQRKISWLHAIVIVGGFMTALGAWITWKTWPDDVAQPVQAAAPAPGAVAPARPTARATARPLRPPVAAPLPARAPATAPQPQDTCPLFADGGPRLPARDTVSPGWHEGARGHADATREQENTRAPMVAYFFTESCRHCREFEREVLSEADVERYFGTFVKLKLNPEDGPDEREIATRFGADSYPALFLVLDGRAIRKATHHRTADGFTVDSPQDMITDFDAELRQAAASQLAAARRLRQAGDQAAAISAYDAALGLRPEFPEAYLERGMALYHSGDVARALEDFRAVLALESRQLEVFSFVGQVLQRQRRFAEAAACWTKLLEADPGSARALLERSRAHEAGGDRARARADAEQACRRGEQAACGLARRL